MDDGLVLRADIFRPIGEGKFPVIFSYGPYGKFIAFQEGYKTSWEIMARENPDAVTGTTNLHQNWEVVDPEKWVPDGYVCVRVDSRGAGRSPGFLRHNDAREQKRRTTRVTRLIRLLRGHGILEKIPHTHRYQINQIKRVNVQAILLARDASPDKLAA